MNTNNIKKVTYNSKCKSLFQTVIGFILCAFILVLIFTNTVYANDFYVLGFFILAAIYFLFGIWGLINPNKKEFMNTNSVKYKLFKKGKITKFIMVSCLNKMLGIIPVLIIVFLLLVKYNRMPYNSETQFGYLIGCIVSILFVGIIHGLLEYYKFKSMKIIHEN